MYIFLHHAKLFVWFLDKKIYIVEGYIYNDGIVMGHKDNNWS